MTATGAVATVRDFASLIKLSHSVFALPFALLSLLVATAGAPPLRLVLLCVAAVVSARAAAMAYNRWLDRDIDAQNPRTQQREIPRGAVSPARALAFTAVCAAAFLVCCWAIGEVCFWLAWPALAWLLLYSHTKRFTVLCHLWLGIALGLAPVAAWVAAEGALTARIATPLWLAAAVATWVAGFDVLYACQDEAFDRAHGLRSLPAALGRLRAMLVSRLLHAAAALAFAAFGWAAGLGLGYALGVAAATALLGWQHWLLRRGDLARIQAAFFTANGVLSIVMLAAGCADLYLFAD